LRFDLNEILTAPMTPTIIVIAQIPRTNVSYWTVNELLIANRDSSKMSALPMIWDGHK